MASHHLVCSSCLALVPPVFTCITAAIHRLLRGMVGDAWAVSCAILAIIVPFVASFSPPPRRKLAISDGRITIPTAATIRRIALTPALSQRERGEEAGCRLAFLQPTAYGLQPASRLRDSASRRAGRLVDSRRSAPRARLVFDLPAISCSTPGQRSATPPPHNPRGANSVLSPLGCVADQPLVGVHFIAVGA